MHYHKINFTRPLFIALLFCIMSHWSLTFGQQPTPKPATPTTQEEVLRIETDLVQTPVMVFDKQGRFIDNLKREQFELRVDGQPQQIAFFERVTAGSQKEAEQYEAARKGTSAQKKPVVRRDAIGRTLIFFVDDMHLTSESTQRTRDALLKFIDNSMGQNDSAVITTASGQLGFLQQLTDNKEVLRLAAGKIKLRQPTALDTDSPPMSPYQAIILDRGGDSGVMRRFADVLIQTQYRGLLEQAQNAGNIGGQGGNRDQQERMMEQLRKQAEQSVKQRARRILSQYSMINQMTYGALENLMRATIQLPGSKLVILISDGFHMAGQSNELTRLNSVTDAAVRSGAVIYSIQASGLNTAMPDARSDVRYTTSMEDSGLDTGLPPVGEDTSLQGPLYTLAVDTGGQPLFNSNSMIDGIKKAIHETSEYYLIAWKPQTSAQRQPGFRKIQVAVSSRPELTVRMQRGFLDGPATPSAEASAKGASQNQATNPQQPENPIRKAISATFPVTDLPTAISVSYIDMPQEGTKLVSVTEVMSGVLFDNPADKQPREIQVEGVVLNDEGKSIGSFSERLAATNDAPADQARPQTVFQIARTQIKPGLYQVRVAALEAKSGRTGSAWQWLLVPDLSSKRLALGSLLIGEKGLEAAKTATPSELDQKARISVDHHFSRNSRLRFHTFIYNASRGQGGTAQPDLAVQMSIMRNDQKISTSPEMKVETTGVEDMTRIPYAAQIKLGTLSPGRYALTVSVTDRNAKTSATQTINFWVE